MIYFLECILSDISCYNSYKSRYLYYTVLEYYIPLIFGALEEVGKAEDAFRGCIVLTRSRRTINLSSD